jgi:tRNA-specific 2-thiouridylase
VQCNNWIKFGRLFDYADSIDAEYVATGHYARLADLGGESALLRGIDSNKDQSYVLAGIDRCYLSRMLLPVGSYVKPDIRKLAFEAGLRVAGKRDSQEICFVTSGKHGAFVRARSTGSTAGRFVTTQGIVVGQHAGIESFTVGQRKGLGVALGAPMFVVRIDPETCDVILGSKEDLERTKLRATHCNWLVEPPTRCFEASVQIRYNSPAVTAQITPVDADAVEVQFSEPARGVAPGQLCVIYQGDRVLGGGWIE